MLLLALAAVLFGQFVAGSEYSRCSGGYCYTGVSFNNVYALGDWKTNENRCVSIYGGHLASVHSSGEAYTVAEVCRIVSGGKCWIGGIYESYNWHWSDGTAFDYEKPYDAPNKCLITYKHYADAVMSAWTCGDTWLNGYVCKNASRSD